MCHHCHNWCSRSACRSQIAPILGKKQSPRGRSQVIRIFRVGFWIRPNLTGSLTIICFYVHPLRTSYLTETLHAISQKNAVELVKAQKYLGFFNQQSWETYLGPQYKFLKIEKFKLESPETIRTSLQPGEWVTSIDFKDAYFHILIQTQSSEYLHFHVQGQCYRFKVLPFGLSTAPKDFTVVAKEIKLKALHKGI